MRAIAVLPLRVGARHLGSLLLGADQVHGFTEDEARPYISLSAQIASIIEAQNLFQQTQIALAQTEALYTGSQQVVGSLTVDQVLNALVDSTILNEYDRSDLMLFDRPLLSDEKPEAFTIAAVWERDSREPGVPVGTLYNLAQFQASEIISPYEPLIVNDITTDDRLDPNTRELMHKRLEGNLEESFGAVMHTEHNYLAISGGGANGAYGAGVLVGWSKQGTRPEFTMVTGISTGALTAPFAFLGSAYDRLCQPPIKPTDGWRYWLKPRLAEVNQLLAQQPFQGMVIACPFTPNVYKMARKAALDAYADWLVDTVIPQAAVKALQQGQVLGDRDRQSRVPQATEEVNQHCGDA